MGYQRARSDHEKKLKRQTILDAAWEELKTNDGQLPTAMQIAKRAKIAKGTVYVYFKTKEEIYLDLFVNRLKAWSLDAEQIMERASLADIVSMSQALAHYPANNPLLLGLGSMLHGILEKNAPFQAVLDMKLQVAEIMINRGQWMHQHLPWLPPRHGAKCMMTIYTLYTSIFQSSASSAELKKELKNRNIDLFDVDVHADMMQITILQLTGLKALLAQAQMP